MSTRILHILVPLLLIDTYCFAQGENPLQASFRRSLRRTSDSTIAAGRAYADTLLGHGDAATQRSLSLFETCVDSLVKASRDSLDSPALLAVRSTELEMRTTLGVMGFPSRLALQGLRRSFEKELPALVERRSACSGCATPGSYEAARASFAAEADSMSGAFADSMATIVESWEDALDDSVVAFSDSVLYEIELLKSDFVEARLAEPVSRLVASAAAQTHASYRGRDNGVPVTAYGPSLTYHHRIGLFAGGSVGWVSRTEPGPDDASLSAGYEFTLSPSFDGSVSYTHYWYSDSSTRPQAVTNQSLEGTFTLDLDAVGFTGTVTYDFGGGSGGAEFTTALDIAKDIMVPGRVLTGTLLLSPALSATWGDQDERLLQKRLFRVKKKAVVVRSAKPSVIFGIMEYEFSFPARLQIGKFAVEPLFEYIIPADVLDTGRTLLNKDPSTSVPFVSCSLIVSMRFD
ncbi:MAG TPA: hypothetical protein VMF59_09130 [Bacteroidota bacterium]|nr:hypothetical protein [Bacteroidota bacterium]